GGALAGGAYAAKGRTDRGGGRRHPAPGRRRICECVDAAAGQTADHARPGGGRAAPDDPAAGTPTAHETSGGRTGARRDGDPIDCAGGAWSAPRESRRYTRSAAGRRAA